MLSFIQKTRSNVSTIVFNINNKNTNLAIVQIIKLYWLVFDQSMLLDISEHIHKSQHMHY